MTFHDANLGVKRDVRVNMDQVETLTWGVILWNKRNINDQYKNAVYAVYCSHDHLLATDAEWWLMALGAWPSPLVPELPMWAMQYMIYEGIDIGNGNHAERPFEKPSNYVPFHEKMLVAKDLGWTPPENWEPIPGFEEQDVKRPPLFQRAALRRSPAAIPESDKTDSTDLMHPGGAGRYVVCVVIFREDSEIVKRIGVNIGVTCKEQLYCRTPGDNDIEMWPSSVVMVTTGEETEFNAEPNVKERAGHWAPIAWEKKTAEVSRGMEERRAGRSAASGGGWSHAG